MNFMKASTKSQLIVIKMTLLLEKVIESKTITTTTTNFDKLEKKQNLANTILFEDLYSTLVSVCIFLIDLIQT